MEKSVCSIITHRARQEFVLSFVAFVLFGALALMTAFYVLVCVFSRMGDVCPHFKLGINKFQGQSAERVRGYYFIVSYILSFVHPWMILVTSGDTRKRLLVCRRVPSNQGTLFTRTGVVDNSAFDSSK